MSEQTSCVALVVTNIEVIEGLLHISRALLKPDCAVAWKTVDPEIQGTVADP